MLKYKTTADIKIDKKLINQIVGQDEAVRIIEKAAKQRRHVLLIGDPGTGKSLIGQAMAELLPRESLTDVLSLHNPADENVPAIRELPRGQGKKLVERTKLQASSTFKSTNLIFIALIFISIMSPWWIRKQYGDILAAAALISSMIFVAAFILFLNLSKRMRSQNINVPKLLIDNSDKKHAAFIEATGAHAGALLGDVLHDPLQTFLNPSFKKKTEKGLFKKSMKQEIDSLINKNKKEIIRQKEKNYEAVFTKKNQLKILAEKSNKVLPVEVLSANRYDYKGDLIKIKTKEGKEIIVTPEHKIAVSKKGRIEYIPASKLKKSHEVFIVK
jgi:ATP-dependent Lon protease